MNHTPSPWTLDSHSPGHEVVLARGGRHAVAAVQGPDDDRENLGNACLIAAAPDLLEVARVEQELQMLGYTRATAKRLGTDAEDAFLSGGPGGLNNWRRQKREAAIAKAEGRS